jgi:hypothetical protein
MQKWHSNMSPDQLTTLITNSGHPEPAKLLAHQLIPECEASPALAGYCDHCHLGKIHGPFLFMIMSFSSNTFASKLAH